MTRVRVDQSAEKGSCIALDDAQAHHLRVVLRLKVGDALQVIDGAGEMWRGRVLKDAPMQVQIEALDESPSADPDTYLEVWLPLLKGGRTDDLMRQLTEIGASEMVCYAAPRSVARLDDTKVAKRISRWQTIVAEATRQCGRRELPKVRYAKGLPSVGPGVYFWERGGASAARAMKSAQDEAKLRILIGPEGGLAAEDAAHLDALGWVALHLGPRILRAETAVLVGATLGLVALGEVAYSDET